VNKPINIVHHVGEDLLVAYAAGALAEGWSLAVATHLSLCPDCRATLATAEAMGGAMIDALPAEPVSAESWEAVKARLSNPLAPVEQRRAEPAHVFPKPLRDYIGSDLDGVRWRMLGKGAAQVRIRTGEKETQVRLLRIPAGQPVPEHSHGGRELTVVLSGAFTDGDTVFARGDIEDADGSITHTPTATPEADCICLAVTDAPLRFSSWLVRLVQPVLGI